MFNQGSRHHNISSVRNDRQCVPASPWLCVNLADPVVHTILTAKLRLGRMEVRSESRRATCDGFISRQLQEQPFRLLQEAVRIIS